MKIIDKLIPKDSFTLDNGKSIESPRNYNYVLGVTLLVITILCIYMTKFDLGILIKRGDEFFKYFINMFPMTEVSWLPFEIPLPQISYLPKIWNPLFDTIKMSVLGSFIGSIAAIPFSMLAASNIVKNKAVISVVRLFLSMARTLPTLVIALIATYIVGLGTFAGTIAIAIFTFAYIGKLLYEQIETVDMGAYEAMIALGSTNLQAFISAIVPQVLPSYIANCLFCFEGNVRYSAILGYVGAGGLGLIINEKIGWREYSSVGMILITLLVTVLVIELISHYLRKKLT